MSRCRCGALTQETLCGRCSVFKRKPEPVVAIQWQPDIVLPDLIPRGAMIHWSDDRRYFYCTKDDADSKYWLSTKPYTGPLDEKQRRSTGSLEPCWAEFSLADGTIYHREALPFSFWKVKRRMSLEEAIDPNAEMFLDYAAVHKWPASVFLPASTAFFDHNGARDIVRPGDWIVTDAEGIRKVWRNKEFTELYARAGDL